MSPSLFRGFRGVDKTCAKHGPWGHKTPLWAFTALPLPSQVTANTLPCSGSPLPAPDHVAILRGFQTFSKHGSPRHKGLYRFTALHRFATAFPGHHEHVALQRQSFASASPCDILHLEGLEGDKTCAKHGPSGHKTPLWAFTALPLPSQVTANTLPCSGSPLPAAGGERGKQWQGGK